MTAHTGIEEKIDKARARGQLLDSAAKNITGLLESTSSDLYRRAIEELVAAEAWAELNDRFYKTLSFGTGGLRGRTIGKIVTKTEQGAGGPNGRPEFPCIGTNAMNFYNVSRATQGLIAYLLEWQAKNIDGSVRAGLALESRPTGKKPSIVIAHDPRFFSKEFSDLAAKVATESGCDAFVFDGPRSTPELSFAVRYLRASAGVVITASHNPPHDNGYKVYFSDGAQVIEPHASGIIAKVNAITGETFPSLAVDRQGKVVTLGQEIDQAYMERLGTLVLDPKIIRETKSLRVVFTPIHGTGGVIIKPMLERLGFEFDIIAAQDSFDGAFPSVKSPNPKNADA